MRLGTTFLVVPSHAPADVVAVTLFALQAFDLWASLNY